LYGVEGFTKERGIKFGLANLTCHSDVVMSRFLSELSWQMWSYRRQRRVR